MHFQNPTTLLLAAPLLISAVKSAAVTLAPRQSNSGQATYYAGNTQGGLCSFTTYTIPSNIYGVALSDSNWDTAAHCGQCITVTGPSGNSILAMIVDECPGCGENHLDLYTDAFAALAPIGDGIIDVTWEYEDSCPITSALQLHNMDSSSVGEYYFSMNVINANKPVASLEVSLDDGSTWTETVRRNYNYWETGSGPTGFGTDVNVDIRVTSVDGDIVVVDDVLVAGSSSTTASDNF